MQNVEKNYLHLSMYKSSKVNPPKTQKIDFKIPSIKIVLKNLECLEIPVF
jgi:hypothetical protein